MVCNHQLLITPRPGIPYPGNTKEGSITVPLTSCLTGLDKSVLQIKTKIVNCQRVDSKPAKQEVNGTVILPPFSIPCIIIRCQCHRRPWKPSSQHFIITYEWVH